jgi:septum formation protein
MIQFRHEKVKKSLILKKKIVLASTSRYRAELLARLQIGFDTAKPDCDETPLTGEKPAETAQRLAIAKARSMISAFPDSLIVGSDQVAELDGVAIGKPGTRARARAQLQAMRGKRVVFHTGVAVVDSAPPGKVLSRLVPTTVTFRHASDAEIDVYLDREDALDCAGSAKSEGLGVALIAGMASDDPTALIGLPLIALTDMLQELGFQVLA